jgi:hypothetical protein
MENLSPIDFGRSKTMMKSAKYRKQHMEWQQKYDVLAPKEGEFAPDFVLSDIDGGNPVRLSDFRDKKPVALIFGSYT